MEFVTDIEVDTTAFGILPLKEALVDILDRSGITGGRDSVDMKLAHEVANLLLRRGGGVASDN